MSNRHPGTGRFTSAMVHDKSTEAIKAKLATPRDPKVTTAHAGVASVSTDSGTAPTQPKTDDGNATVNDAFNQKTKGPNFRPGTVIIGGR
jgi:hypothetical protein